MRNLRQIVKIAEKFTVDNAPTLMTGLGVAGVITTAIFTAKATVKAHVILEQNKPIDFQTHKGPALTAKEKASLVWKLYIPAVATGTLTCVSIVAANRVGMRRYAAMAAAYSISETAFGEYKDKVVEHMGKEKEQKVRDEVQEDRVKRDLDKGQQVIITGNGKAMFHDTSSGRIFESDAQSIRKAMNDLNQEIINSMGGYVTLNEWYSRIGLPSTGLGSELGWDTDNLLDVNFSSTLINDTAYVSIDYAKWPIREHSFR